MAAELFNRHVGLKMLHVPYKGNAQAIVDVISGQVTMMFDQVSTSAPHIRAGKLRGLAVTSLKRSPLLPDLPTIDESGMRGFEDITFNGLVAPAGTPREILVRLNADVAKAVATPEYPSAPFMTNFEAARACSRWRAMAASKPAWSSVKPRSRQMSAVRSIGKPKVS